MEFFQGNHVLVKFKNGEVKGGIVIYRRNNPDNQKEAIAYCVAIIGNPRHSYISGLGTVVLAYQVEKFDPNKKGEIAIKKQK